MLHFTSDVDTLVKIISDGFRPNYKQEYEENDVKAYDAQQGIGAFIPMCSFCNIPLLQVSKNLLQAYGNIGIGMDESWTDITRLNPVAYIGPYAPIALVSNESARKLSSLAYMIKHYVNFYGDHVLRSDGNAGPYLLEISSQVQELGEDIFSMQGFTKPYESRNFKGIENYRYYDEREWRYIPPSLWSTLENGNPEIPFILPASKSKEVDTYNERLHSRKDFYLSTPIDKISYILLSEDKIPDFTNQLRKLKDGNDHPRFSESEVLTLVSLIVTTRQIL